MMSHVGSMINYISQWTDANLVPVHCFSITFISFNENDKNGYVPHYFRSYQLSI